MKRFHVHLKVENLNTNIQFYSALFGASPTVEEADYAKWMLEDPKINFAISLRAENELKGISHIGVEFDSEIELKEIIGMRARDLPAPTIEEADANCCYANSYKQWLLDPQNVVWEFFHSEGRIKEYGTDKIKHDIKSAATENFATQQNGCCFRKTM